MSVIYIHINMVNTGYSSRRTPRKTQQVFYSDGLAEIEIKELLNDNIDNLDSDIVKNKINRLVSEKGEKKVRSILKRTKMNIHLHKSFLHDNENSYYLSTIPIRNSRNSSFLQEESFSSSSKPNSSRKLGGKRKQNKSYKQRK